MADDNEFLIEASLNMSSTVQNIQAQLKDIESQLKPINLDVKINSDNINAVQQQTTKVTSSTKDLSTQFDILQSRAIGAYGSFQKYIQQNSKAAQEFSSNVKDIGDLYSTLQNETDFSKAKTEYQQLTSSVSEFKGEVRTAGLEGKTFGETFENALSKFGGWITVGTVFMSAVNEVKQGISDVIDLNTKLSQTAEAMGMSVSNLGQLATSAQSIATSMGANVSDVLDIAHIYANEQTSLTETIEHTKSAVELMNISGLSSSASSDALQGVQQAFGITADKLEHVNDVMATLASNVKINYQTAIQDMSQAISTSGTAAHESGMSLEEYLAVTIKAAETTRQTGDTIATAEKTIFARVGQSKTAISELGTTSDDISKAATALKSTANVDVMDQQTGKMRDMQDILSDLSKKWDGLSRANQNYVAYAASGVRQTNIFEAIMKDYASATNLATKATNNVGAAAKANATYLESTEAKIKQFESTATTIWQNIISSSTVNGVVDSGTKILDVIAQVTEKLGAIPTLLATISAGLSMAGKNNILSPVKFSVNDNGGLDFSSIFSKNTSAINEDVQALTRYNTAIQSGMNSQSAYYTFLSKSNDATIKAAESAKGGVVDIEAYTAATEGSTIATKAETLAVGALNTVLNTAIIAVIAFGIEKAIEYFSNLKTATQQAQDALTTASKNFDDANQKVSDTNTKLQDINKQISDLQSKGSLTFVEKNQLQTLQQTSAELQTQLETEQALAIAAKDTQTQAAIDAINKQKAVSENPNTGIAESGASPYKNSYDGANDALKHYQELMKQNTQESIAQANTIKTNLLNLAKQYTDNASKIDVSYSAEAASAQKSATDQANAILKVVDTANYQTSVFNSVYKNVDFSGVATQLSKLAQQGKLTVQTLNGSQYSVFIQAMKNVGLSVSDVVNQINALNRTKVESSPTDPLKNIDNELQSLDGKYNTVTEDITNYEKALKDLDTAIDDQQKGTLLTGEQVSKLIGEYPELTSKVIDTGNGYKFVKGALDDVRKAHIQEETTTINAAIADMNNTISSCQKQIDAYSNLLGSIKTVAEAKAKLANINNEIKTNPENQPGFIGPKQGKDFQEKFDLDQYISKNADISGYESQLNSYKQKVAALKEQENLVGANNYQKTDQTDENKAANAAEKAEKAREAAAKKAEEAAKAAHEALENQYKSQLKIIESDKEMDKYSSDKYGVEGLQYYTQLLALQNQYKNSQIDADDKAELASKVLQAHKDYEQSILDTSYKELDSRQKLGQVQENSKGTLQNLLEIQRMLNSSGMSLVDTKDAQLDVEEKIYDVEKAMQEQDKSNIESLLTTTEDMLKKNFDTEKQQHQDRLDQIKKEEQVQKDKNDAALQAIKDQISLQEKQLEQEKDAHDHNEEQADKQKAVSDIQAELVTIGSDTSDSAAAKRLELQDKLTDAQKALTDEEYNYSIDTQKNALSDLQDQYEKEYDAKDKELEKEEKAQEDAIQKEVDAIDKASQDEVAIRTQAMNLINSKSQSFYNQLIAYNQQYGDGISEEITNSWNSAYASLSNYNNGVLNVLSTLKQLSQTQKSYSDASNLVNSKATRNQSSLNSNGTYTVKKNDSMSGIASWFGISLNDLESANNNIKKVSAGQKVNIPHYASGTDDAQQGIGEVAEDKAELIIGNQLKNFQGGEIVLNGDDTANLLSGKKADIQLAEGISDNADKITDSQQDIIDKLKANLDQLAQDCIQYGKNLNTKVSNGIDNNKEDTVLSSQNKVIQDMVDTVLRFVDNGVQYGESLNVNFASGQNEKAILPKQSTNNLIADLSATNQKYVSDNTTFGQNIDTNLSNGINANSKLPQTSTSNLTNSLTAQIKTFVNGNIDYGKGIVNELDSGINDSKSQKQLTTDVNKLTDLVIKQFKQGFGIHSPSKVMYQIGDYLMQGLVNGMSSKDVQSFVSSQVGSTVSAATNSGMQALSSGVDQWKSMASMALMMTGHYSPQNLALLMAQMNTESGGNSSAVNLWDSNAKAGHPSQGLMQVIPSTFSTYALPGYNSNILDPLSNILAAIRYTWSAYGGFDVWGKGHGYKNGTRNSVGGLIEKNEGGNYEAEMQPSDGGDYEWVPANSIIFNAQQTDTLYKLANGMNPMELANMQMQSQLKNMSSNAVVNNQNNSTPISIEMPIVVNGTADESILNGLKSERNHIINAALQTIKNARINVGTVKTIYNT